MTISASLSSNHDADIIDFIQKKKNIGVTYSKLIKIAIKHYKELEEGKQPFQAESEIENKLSSISFSSDIIEEDKQLKNNNLPLQAKSEKIDSNNMLSKGFVNNLLK